MSVKPIEVSFWITTVENGYILRENGEPRFATAPQFVFTTEHDLGRYLSNRVREISLVNPPAPLG